MNLLRIQKKTLRVLLPEPRNVRKHERHERLATTSGGNRFLEREVETEVQALLDEKVTHF